MEFIFLVSNLQSRKVKKLELLNVLDLDFESYFEINYGKIQETYEYFRGIKYYN
jgi:hypothetical protein